MTTPAHRDDQGASEQGNWSCDAIGLADPKDRNRGKFVGRCLLVAAALPVVFGLIRWAAA